jgi:hypothetical protein
MRFLFLFVGSFFLGLLAAFVAAKFLMMHWETENEIYLVFFGASGMVFIGCGLVFVWQIISSIVGSLEK